MSVRKCSIVYLAETEVQPVDTRLLTPEQVAERLQVTEHTVYLWLQSGKLAGAKLGRLWRVRPEALEAFLRRHEKSASREAYDLTL